MDVFWLQQTESDVPKSNDWLSAIEVSRLSGRSVPKRRNEWRLGRWTAKRAVAACLQRSAELPLFQDIEIRPTSSGAPEVFLAGQLAPVCISLSHRAGMAIAAVASSGIALGCDLELVEQRCDSFAADYFSAQEQRFVMSAPLPDRPAVLTLLWSAKESALKAVREGLRRDTRSMLVKVADMTSFSTACAQSTPPNNHGWHAMEIADISSGRVLHGWWQRTGAMFRTVVADPFLSPPVLFAVPILGWA